MSAAKEKFYSEVRRKMAVFMASEFRTIQKGQLEHCCEMVIDAGLSTGHADTIEDLVLELISQTKK